MVQIISEKANDYDAFFAEVLESLKKQYKHSPKLLIFGVPDSDEEDRNNLHMSTYGMDSFDLFQVAAAIQHEAIRDIVVEEQAMIESEIGSEFDDWVEEESEEDDESEKI